MDMTPFFTALIGLLYAMFALPFRFFTGNGTFSFLSGFLPA
jgi:hypothetical protein